VLRTVPPDRRRLVLIREVLIAYLLGAGVAFGRPD
jgi:hypothetical protein